MGALVSITMIKERALAGSVTTAILCGAALLSAALPAASADVPNFMGDRSTAWIPDRPTGDDFLAPPSGPGPVMSVKERPYVPNGVGQQPTYRIADLTNPILKPWVVERMKKANDEVFEGKVPYITREHCWPAGVPGYTVYTRVQPIHFIQTFTTSSTPRSGAFISMSRIRLT